VRKFLLTIIVLLSLLFGEKAQSQIVYTDIEPDTTMIFVLPFISDDYYVFDVNSDGIDDFKIHFELNWGEGAISACPLENFEFIRHETVNGVDTLQLNDSINNNCLWTSSELFLCQNYSGLPSIYCLWYNCFNRFAGFRVKSGTDYFYGWIRFRNYNTISDFAINQIPNDPIVAGEGLPAAAERVAAFDAGDNQNGLDLRITAEKSMWNSWIQSYRIMAVKSGMADTFDVEDANNVISSDYIEVLSDGSSIDTVFSEFSTSADGAIINEFIPYKIFVLSVADGINLNENVLSSPSQEIILTSPCDTASNLQIEWIYSGGTRYDINYSFEKAIDESAIVEYRVYFVKEDSMTMFTVDYASALTHGSYISHFPSGENVSVMVNSDSLNDFTSGLISHNVNYVFVVMSIANGSQTNVNTFSAFSASFKLASPLLQVKGPLVIDNSDFGDGRDIKISFFKRADETGLAEYRIIAVKKEAVSAFNMESANLLTEEKYLQVLPTGANHELILDDTFLDSDGDNIVSGQPYRFFILSVADMIIKDINALSIGSNIITIEEPNRIYAGQTTGEGIYYTDIEPDISLNTYFGITESYELDLNNDGTSDFIISAYQNGSPGFQRCYSGMNSFLTNEISFIQNTNSPDTLRAYYMINEDLYWTSEDLSFGDYFFTGNPYTDFNIGIWNPLSNYYTGLLLITPVDTLYGWISFGYVNSCQVTIKGYAYQVISNSVSEIPDNQNLQIFPNPITTQLQAQLLLINEPISDDNITIKNLTGITIKSQTINENRLLMNVEDLSPGIYFLEWNHKGMGYRKKFVVCR